MRRRKPPAVAGTEPPSWVTRTLDGLVKFTGDGRAWGRARAEWCRDNRCRRAVPCSAWGREQCQRALLQDGR